MFPMLQSIIVGTFLALAVPGLSRAEADGGISQPLSVEQILDRYQSARGGAEAWQKIQTMAWTGHVESGPGGANKSPFLMLFKRPGATRFEVLAQGQHLVRAFDGANGWKQQPNNSGVPQIKHYSAEEITYARDTGGLDGPLADSQSKGVTVALRGVESVDGHEAYRLSVTLPSGQTRTDWLDAQSFLEIKYDREARNAAGRSSTVSVYYRDYHSVEGLVMPFTIETGGTATNEADKMVIEKIAINPKLEDVQFAEPTAPGSHHKGVLVDTTVGR
jgi:hypothetical protein